MNSDERQMIQSLFTRLGEAERSAPPRDSEAESFIRERVANAPQAPYYMAQTIIVQEEALKAASARIEELERAERQQPAQSSGGGFLSGLFGGSSAPRDNSRPMGVPSGYRGGAGQDAGYGNQTAGRSGPWGGGASAAGSTMGGYAQQAAPGRGGGGFLAGAAQTAVGVAGGVMLGSMLGNMFSGTDSFLNPEANAAEQPTAEPTAQETSAQDTADNSYQDSGMQDANYEDPGFGGDADFEDI